MRIDSSDGTNKTIKTQMIQNDLNERDFNDNDGA